MESFNPHEYVPRRLDAPAKFLLWIHWWRPALPGSPSAPPG